MSYTIKLNDGKYTIIGHNSFMGFLRYGEPWPAADDLQDSNLVRAMFDRIEELEMAIGQVLDGSLDERGSRRKDGLKHWDTEPAQYGMDWEQRLRNVLEQKP